MPVSETVLLEQGGRVARDVGTAAVQQSGNFLTGLIGAPFNAIGSAVRDGFGGIMSLGIPAALGTMAVFLVAPDLVRGAGELTGRTDISDNIGAQVREGGLPRAALLAAGIGAGLGGGFGVLRSVWRSITGGGAEGSAPRSSGAQLGQTVGTLATFAAVTAVAIGAMNRNSDIRHDAGGEAQVTPPPVPTTASAQRSAAAVN